MAHIPPTDDRLDRDLIVLLDAALTAVADSLTPEQCAHLRERTGKMGLSDHIKRRCSPEVQHVRTGYLGGLPDGPRSFAIIVRAARGIVPDRA